MSAADSSMPRYGEVWMIDGSDERDDAHSWPAVVVSSDAMEGMPWRLVARIDSYIRREPIWRVEVPHAEKVGVERRSVVDTMQLHCVELGHCIRRIGRLPADCMMEVAAAIAIVVEYQV